MLGFLFSYWYCRTLDMDDLVGKLDPAPPLFADSGAYSAKVSGTPIDVEQYSDWLDRWKHLFPVYANLDVIGDVDGSDFNHRFLIDRGHNPIPVFHAGEPWSILERMCAEHSYVALGGLVGGAMSIRNARLLGWIQRCFEIAGTGTGLHGFGMTSWDVVKRFPWHSVDSSSVGGSFRYGTVTMYDPYSKRWLKWRLADKRAWGINGWLVREYGLTPGEFHETRTPACRRALMLLAARSYKRAAEDLAHTQVFVTDSAFQWKNDGESQLEIMHRANGPQVFAATGAGRNRDLDDLVDANAPTQVYVTDSAMSDRDGSDRSRLDRYNDANRTQVYVTSTCGPTEGRPWSSIMNEANGG